MVILNAKQAHKAGLAWVTLKVSYPKPKPGEEGSGPRVSVAEFVAAMPPAKARQVADRLLNS